MILRLWILISFIAHHIIFFLKFIFLHTKVRLFKAITLGITFTASCTLHLAPHKLIGIKNQHITGLHSQYPTLRYRRARAVEQSCC